MTMSDEMDCDVCAGTGKPVSGLPCICGGTGSNIDEKAGLRRKVHEMELQIGEFQKILNPMTKEEFIEIVSQNTDLRRELQEKVRLNRAWERAINECCECGGKGPQDPGVCLACKVYHLARALADKRIEPSQKCPRCPCPHDWNTVKSHTEHFDGPTICTRCGNEGD